MEVKRNIELHYNKFFVIKDKINYNLLPYDKFKKVLLNFPRVAKFCNLNKLDGWDWFYLLMEYPQFAKYCNWDKLNNGCWYWLLRNMPQFADFCDWNKIDILHTSYLIQNNPHLEKYRIVYEKK